MRLPLQQLDGNGARKSGWRSFAGGNGARKRAAPEKELLTGVEVAEQERLEVPGNGARKRA